ncbi:MAG: putative Ig domain-containing protein [Patescibacteria group bacterium]
MAISRSQPINLGSILLRSALTIFFVISVFGIAGFGWPWPARADISQTVTNGIWNSTMMSSSSPTWYNIGQLFYPNTSSISGIKVYLTRTVGTNQTNYYLDLYHGLPTVQASYTSLGTATLAYTSIAESADGNQEANFVFPSAITLIPSHPYFFRLSLQSYATGGVRSSVAWTSQIDGEMLAWGTLPQADNLQSGNSNLEMYFITYKLADPLVITTTTLPAITATALYNQTLVATGGTTPLTWSLSAGALPAGLTLSSAGVISGLPTIAGTSSFTVRVTDNASVTADQTLSIIVNPAPVITTTTLPAITATALYNQTLTATGGTAPLTWSLLSGTLPTGLTLSAGGVISGTPTIAGTSSFTVRVTDNAGVTADQALVIIVNPAGGGGGGSGSLIVNPDPNTVGVTATSQTTTTNPVITLDFTYGSDIVLMAISNENRFDNSSLRSAAKQVNWQLESGYGLKTVYVLFQNASGGSVIKNLTITLSPLTSGTSDQSASSNAIPTPRVLGEQCVNTIAAERLAASLADDKLISRLKGYILLQVESVGEAWYVDPISGWRYYLPDGPTAYKMLELAGLGITDNDLSLVPVGLEKRFYDQDTDGDGLSDKLEQSLGTAMSNSDTDGDGLSDGVEVEQGANPLLIGKGKVNFNSRLTNRLRGRILLQVKSLGQAWFVNPADSRRYYMPDGEAAWQIMRYLGYGISNADLSKIPVAEYWGKEPYTKLVCGQDEPKTGLAFQPPLINSIPPSAQVLGESTTAISHREMIAIIEQSYNQRYITAAIVRKNLLKELKFIGIQLDKIKRYRINNCRNESACLAKMDKQKSELSADLFNRLKIQYQHKFITAEGYNYLLKQVAGWFDSN